MSTLSTLSTLVFSQKHRIFLEFDPSISDDTVDSVDILRGLLFGNVDSDDSIFIDTPPYTAWLGLAKLRYIGYDTRKLHYKLHRSHVTYITLLDKILNFYWFKIIYHVI